MSSDLTSHLSLETGFHMRRPLRLVGIATAAVAATATLPILLQGGAEAAHFTGGNLVVYRVGTSGGSLTNAAAPVFLDEFTAAGSRTQSIAVPTAAADGNQPLTAAGLSRSEGQLSRSADGHFVTFTGYAAAPGTTGANGLSLTTTDPVTVKRVVGFADANGAVDTSNVLATGPKIVRTAVSTDGNRIYAAGGDRGVLTKTFGSATSSVVAGDAAANLTDLTVQGGQLYASGILSNRLAKVGTGVPTSAATLSDVPGLPANLLTFGYAFADLTAADWAGTGDDTLYVANASSRGGTVDKYIFSGDTWAKAGSVDVEGAFGLVADVNNGVASLAVTTPTALLSITDHHAAESGFAAEAPVVLAAAEEGTEFRGVALAPTAASGPSVYVRQPVTATSISRASGGLKISAYVAGSSVTSVKAKINAGAYVNAVKGTGNVWTATVPVNAAVSGNATVVATDSTGTTTVSRAITVTPIVAPAGTAGPAKYSWLSSKVVRTGTWSTFSTTLSPDKKGLYSKVAGRKVTVKPYGRGLVLSFVGRKDAGKVRITVDGVSATLDLYRATTATVSKTWTWTTTGAIKAHTVVITVLGQKSSKATAANVFLGSFQVKP